MDREHIAQQCSVIAGAMHERGKCTRQMDEAGHGKWQKALYRLIDELVQEIQEEGGQDASMG